MYYIAKRKGIEQSMVYNHEEQIKSERPLRSCSQFRSTSIDAVAFVQSDGYG